MNKRLLFLGAAAALSIGIVGTAFYAANKNLASLEAAGPVNIELDPDPVVVETVTETYLTYTDFPDYTGDRNLWAKSPNGNLIGLFVGGNYTVNDGVITLLKDTQEEAGSWINTNSVVTNGAERKYAFSEIMSITVSFTGSLSVETPSGTQALSSGIEKNLDNASSFKIFPTSNTADVSSIKVMYNSTADRCY